MKLAFESEDAAKQIFPYKCDWAPYNIELNHSLFDYVSWNTVTLFSEWDLHYWFALFKFSDKD